MIRHCVFAKFRNDVTDAEREAIFFELGALQHKLDGVIAMALQRQRQSRRPQQGLRPRLHDGFPRRRSA